MRLFDSAKNKLTETRRKGLSLELRMLLTLFAMILTLVFCVLVIFAALGSFDINRSQTAALLGHELDNIAERIGADYAVVASHAIELSENLSYELERQLETEEVDPSALSLHPELLNRLTEGVYPIMSAEIKALKSSGVFIIFDATVNPALEDAQYSRAGMFLKNISAQNNAFSSHYDLRYLYGSYEVGREHELTFLPQWKLEFDVSDMDMFNTPLATAKSDPSAPLSQLYYWTAKESDGGSDSGMYCSVPLIASDGTVMGVCGYEISQMQFKLAYSPALSGQNYAFCMLAPSDDEHIYFEKAMFAGNYAVAVEQPKCTVKKPQGEGFLTYPCEEAGLFLGNHRSVSLYPKSSHYAGASFDIVLLTPKLQISRLNVRSNIKYTAVILIMLAVGGAAALILCKSNIKPIRKALASLRGENAGEKTRIPEIDDLFAFLSEKDREHEEELNNLERERLEAQNKAMLAAQELSRLTDKKRLEIDDEAYGHFLASLGTLTPREHEVFDLYMDGKSAKEIIALLGFSDNALKYHNRNIYEKLGVSSRKELLLYAALMKRDKTKNPPTSYIKA